MVLPVVTAGDARLSAMDLSLCAKNVLRLMKHAAMTS
jgi:hypothetical protein